VVFSVWLAGRLGWSWSRPMYHNHLGGNSFCLHLLLPCCCDNCYSIVSDFNILGCHYCSQVIQQDTRVRNQNPILFLTKGPLHVHTHIAQSEFCRARRLLCLLVKCMNYSLVELHVDSLQMLGGKPLEPGHRGTCARALLAVTLRRRVSLLLSRTKEKR